MEVAIVLLLAGEPPVEPELPIQLSTVTAALEKPVYSRARTSAAPSVELLKVTVTVGVVVVETKMFLA